MPHRSSLLAAAIAALCLVMPAAASAAHRPRIIYPENGIAVAGQQARLTGTAAKLARFWVGKRLDTTCEKVSHVNTFGVSAESVAMTRFTGTVVRLGSTAGKDYCVVDHPTPDQQGEPVAIVALTPAGKAWIQELQLSLVVISAGPEYDGQGPVPTADAVVRSNPKVYVALPTPDAVPPAGKIGYWSDGVQHDVVAMTAPSGRRLFLESEADGVIRTNILEYTSVIGLT
jgi:hypothetical protein